MKERPILFSGPMVRAILDGRKTQTRRPYNPKAGFPREDGEVTPTTASAWTDYGPCPLGQPGDRLWVRETWYGMRDGGNSAPCVAYAADNPQKPDWCRWSPSIHMPRWASRITLEITRVWVERVQDITEEDAKAEGIIDGGCLSCGDREPCPCNNPKPDRRDSFVGIWQSIYGTWDGNPWVWAVEFRRIKP